MIWPGDYTIHEFGHFKKLANTGGIFILFTLKELYATKLKATVPNKFTTDQSMAAQYLLAQV